MPKTVDASAWEPSRPHCRTCDTDLVAFEDVTPVDARRYVTLWGDENDAVPGCPACTDPGSGQPGCEDVPKAIKVAITDYGGQP